MSGRRIRRRLCCAVLCGPALLLATPSEAAPPERSPAVAEAEVVGRVLEAGGARRGVAGAVVLLVDAPADARPGKSPRDQLEPETVSWTRRVETDEHGEFALTDVPVGKVRVIVIAGGFARYEVFAEVATASERNRLVLYLRPEAGEYRTEVRVERPSDHAVEPEHVVDGEQARRYAGSGGDPLLAAQNLPGIARSPLGFGMIGFRGGDPTQAGLYLDGHPIPRAYHVLPIASVVPAPMLARVQLRPGNYPAAFGSYGGGLVEIESRPGRREGIHGEAHLDLFDVGTTVEGPVGAGSVHVGVRRSHVGDVLRAIEGLPIGSPNFWDYLARFDHPLGVGHRLTVRALGAGDRLTYDESFDFGAAFHRFDLEYRRTSAEWTAVLSPSLRLDRSQLEQNYFEGWERHDRTAQVYSFRAAFTRRGLAPWLRLEFGSDVVAERWRHWSRWLFSYYNLDGEPNEPLRFQARGDQLRLGAWLSIPLEFSGVRIVPSVRANVFAYSGYPSFRLDPRLDLWARVNPRIELFGALGMYSTPIVIGYSEDSDLIEQNGELGDGVVDVPQYLIDYFEPNIATSVQDRTSSATYFVHASAGAQASLPWQLDARATLFWREGLPTTIERLGADSVYVGRQRSYGLELLLRRSLANDVLEGWIGYTLMWARTEDSDRRWLPAVFDQRHNLVALLSTQLPRGFRLGLRFRLVSGNPETPVVGREIFENSDGSWLYRPIRAPRGTSYQPLFHQLDLRVDKQWTLKRTSVTAYLDVQNVYNHIYPEVRIYTTDWADRRSLIGLPIYPSLGVQVRF